MRTHTEYDFEHLYELQRVVSKAITHAAVFRRRIINLGLSLLFGAMAVLLAVQQKHWAFVVIVGVIALYFFVGAVFFYQFAALSAVQSVDRSAIGSDYFFEKSYLRVVNPKESRQYDYQDCERLLETERNFYFITPGGQGLILDKSNLKGGTADQMRDWLEKKSGHKTEWMGRG